MTRSPQFGGRVLIRLSSVDKKIRVRTAERLGDQILRSNASAADKLAQTTILRRVAEDPVAAALELPTHCENRVFEISAEAYERVCRNGKEA